jgi:hypothetical protein
MAVENGKTGLGKRVGWLSLPAGFVNGVWVILAGTGYFAELSPYYWLFRGASGVGVPVQITSQAKYFLFSAGFQFVLAPLSGALLGLLIGWLATRKNGRPDNAIVRITGTVMGGIGGAVSVSIVFLNVYAS